MGFKGTKGKWEVNDGVIKTNNGETICFAAVLTSRIDEERLCGESWLEMRDRTKLDRENCAIEKKANALLISKAPEMLGMLKKLRAAILSEDYIRMLASSQEAFDLIKEATEIE